MKKFKQSDVLHSTIKAYPKVEFYYNNGRMFLDRQNYPDNSSDVPYGSIGLFELIHKLTPQPFGVVADGVLLAENEDFLMSEINDENLAFE